MKKQDTQQDKRNNTQHNKHSNDQIAMPEAEKNARACKRWFIVMLSLAIAALVILGGFVAFVDPYFHFHAPISFIRYSMDNERYINNGIVRNFDYDAIITGSSMSENFKASELSALFDVNAIKVPYAGGSYKETGDNLAIALASHPDVKMVVRAMDYDRMFNDKDHVDYDSYPSYLYDNNPFNDVNYLFNMDVLFVAIQDVVGVDSDGPIDDDFDSYANWMAYYSYGKEALDAYYHRDQVERTDEVFHLTEEDKVTMQENFQQNVISLVEAYPDTQFYLYFTPFCIYYWDNWKLTGQLERQLEAEKYAIEMLLPYENIHLFSFNDHTEITCNLDNYRDVAHHVEDVNSQILVWMKEGTGLLTPDNYQDYCERVAEIYRNYDYEALFQE